MGQSPGIIIVSGKRGDLGQKRRDADPLKRVTIGKDQLLLAEIAAFCQLLFEILHSLSHPFFFKEILPLFFSSYKPSRLTFLPPVL